jgi:hypothetical protein
LVGVVGEEVAVVAEVVPRHPLEHDEDRWDCTEVDET